MPKLSLQFFTSVSHHNLCLTSTTRAFLDQFSPYLASYRTDLFPSPSSVESPKVELDSDATHTISVKSVPFSSCSSAGLVVTRHVKCNGPWVLSAVRGYSAPVTSRAMRPSRDVGDWRFWLGDACWSCKIVLRLTRDFVDTLLSYLLLMTLTGFCLGRAMMRTQGPPIMALRWSTTGPQTKGKKWKKKKGKKQFTNV